MSETLPNILKKKLRRKQTSHKDSMFLHEIGRDTVIRKHVLSSEV